MCLSKQQRENKMTSLLTYDNITLTDSPTHAVLCDTKTIDKTDAEALIAELQAFIATAPRLIVGFPKDATHAATGNRRVYRLIDGHPYVSLAFEGVWTEWNRVKFYSKERALDMKNQANGIDLIEDLI